MLSELGLHRCVVVCGRHFAPKAEELVSSMDELCTVFGGVEQNPQLSGVEETVKLAREHGADAIIGIGGGSAIDTAKFAAAITLDGGDADRILPRRAPLPCKASARRRSADHGGHRQ